MFCVLFYFEHNINCMENQAMYTCTSPILLLSNQDDKHPIRCVFQLITQILYISFLFFEHSGKCHRVIISYYFVSYRVVFY